MNGYVFLFLSFYLVLTLKNDNAKKLLDALSNEGDFAKWAISLAIINMVAGKLGKAGDALTVLVYVAMLLTASRKNPKVFNNLSNVLNIGE